MDTMTKPDEVIIRLSGIFKKFGAIQALNDVSFELKKGEIHGIVGENGAGKTTLMSVLHGTVKSDRGDIIVKGNYYKSMNPSIAKEIGIAIIPQKIQLFPQLSVAENIFINNWPRHQKNRFISWSKMHALSEEILDKVELDINPFMKVSELSYIEQQMLEIARVFFVERVEVIILDEPTGPLAIHEVDILFDFIRSLQAKGVSFIYISHYLDEIFKICDRVTTLRDGKVVSVKSITSIDMKTLVQEMVGEGVDLYPGRKQNIGETVLEVKKFVVDPIIKNVNFILKKGEILGIAGLKGSGRTELLRAICGLDRYSEGEIYFRGKNITINNVRKGLDLGIGYLTEDRIKWGLFLIRSVRENVTITFLRKIINKIGILKIKEEDRIVRSYVKKLDIKTSTIDQPLNYLSGGNQQKVIIAKLLGSDLDVFLFDEPTFGIDVRAKMYIHEIMNALVTNGKSIILISSDILELTGMSDRILVLKNGEIVQELLKDEINDIKLQGLLEGKLDDGYRG